MQICVIIFLVRSCAYYKISSISSCYFLRDAFQCQKFGWVYGVCFMIGRSLCCQCYAVNNCRKGTSAVPTVIPRFRQRRQNITPKTEEKETIIKVGQITLLATITTLSYIYIHTFIRCYQDPRQKPPTKSSKVASSIAGRILHKAYFMYFLEGYNAPADCEVQSAVLKISPRAEHF